MTQGSLAAAEIAALDALHAQGDDLVETVMAWSRINSWSWNAPGLEAMADAILARLARLPGRAYLEPSQPVQVTGADGKQAALAHGAVIRLSVRPEAKVRALLVGHRDTVFPPTSPFQEPVWSSPGRLNGPGVADMKGGILLMIAALEALETSPWGERMGYDVLINADEEVSSLGSAGALVSAAKTADFALVFEPALPDGTLAGARKGIGSFSAIARGRAAHAGRNPQEGRNAVLAVSDLFLRLRGLAQERPGVTVNVARVDGGGPTNVVPDLAVGRFEVRAGTHEDAHWAETRLQQLVRETAGDHDLDLALEGQFHRPPKPMDKTQTALFSAVKACGADLGLPVAWTATGGCCDGNNLAATGLAVVDTMGVRGGAIHSSDEFLLTESLVERARLSALVLMRMAQGALDVPLARQAR